MPTVKRQKIIILFTISLFFFLQLFFLSSLAVNAATPNVGLAKTENELQLMLKKPQPRISIPGLNFSPANLSQWIKEDDTGKKFIYIPYLGEYIASIYKYAVAATSIIAVIIIIYSGFQWSASGGNSEKIADAQKKILTAIIGILLTSGSYTILKNINPELVNFRNLKVQYFASESVGELSEITTDSYEKATGKKLDNSEQARKKNVDMAVNSAKYDSTTNADPSAPSSNTPSPTSPTPDSDNSNPGVPTASQNGTPAIDNLGLPECLVKVIVYNESRGSPAVIGHDEDVGGTKARKKFLEEGKTYQYIKSNGTSGRAFTKKEASSEKIRNDDGRPENRKQIIGDPPDYGLDWRFSHGIGMGQFTLTGEDWCVPNEVRGAYASGSDKSGGGKCYTIPELLSVEVGIQAMVKRMSAWHNIAKKNTGITDPNNEKLIRYTFSYYGAGYKGDNSEEILNREGVNKRVTQYFECVKTGGASVALPASYQTAMDSAGTGAGGNSFVQGSFGSELSGAMSNKPKTIEELQIMIKKPQPKIGIPGLSFSTPDILNKLSQMDDQGNAYIYIPFLGEYIAAVYKYGVAASGIVCVILIIMAGFQWINSRGNSEAINKAQKKITACISGLIIAVGSYTILYLINPELINFKSLRILYIPEKGIAEIEAETYASTDPQFEYQSGNMKYMSGSPSSAPGTTGGSENLYLAANKEEAAKIANDLDTLYCQPTNLSTEYPELETFLKNKGVSVDLSLFGKLDCNKGATPRPPDQIDRVVLHCGFMETKPNTGKTKARATVVFWRKKALMGEVKVASHFIIDRQGVIYPLIDTRFFAAHAPSQNKRSVGIDFQYDSKSSKEADIFFTDQQYKSAAALIEYLQKKHPKIQAKDYNIMGHGECQDNRTDPQNFNFEKLKAYIPNSSFNNSLHNRLFVSPEMQNISAKLDFTKHCEYITANKQTTKQ